MARFIQPPRDPLRDVFTRETLDDWRAVLNPVPELTYRIKTAEASGPFPTDARLARDLRRFRAHKAAWHAYIYSAFACGMFEGIRGKELRGRLRSPRSEQFQSAIAECLVCWFLAGRKKLTIDTCAPGREDRMLEMKIISDVGEVGVEVKAPYEEIPEYRPGETSVKCVDDARKLAPCMVAANKQFDRVTPNLLVLVPMLERSIVRERNDLIRAAYVQSVITWPFNPETGSAGDTSLEFVPGGKFLETKRPGGKQLKMDGLPAYRRISAILCIEERAAERYSFPDPFVLRQCPGLFHSWCNARDLHYSSDNEVWIEHDAILVHNPFAYHLLEQETWREIPQLIPDGDTMKWSDRYPINV